MKRSRITAIAIVVIIALAAVPFAYAQGFRGHGHGRAFGHGHAGEFGVFGHFDRIKQALNLSDDQVAQIKAIKADLKAQNAPYAEQLKGGRQAIAQLLLNDPTNVAGATALMNQREAAEHAIKANTLNAFAKGLNVLNADQRAKVSQFMADRQARREQFKQQHQ